MQTLNTEHAISLPIDTIMGTASEKIKKYELEEFKLKPIKLTGQLPNILRLQLGIEYMCTLNQDVPDSIVNGTTGILRKICYDSKLKPFLIFL